MSVATRRQVFDCTMDQYIDEIHVGNKWVEIIELDCEAEDEEMEQTIRSKMSRITEEYKNKVSEENIRTPEIQQLYKDYEEQQSKLVSLGYEKEKTHECSICMHDYYVSLEYNGYSFGCSQENHNPCRTCFNRCESCPMCRADKQTANTVIIHGIPCSLDPDRPFAFVLEI